ncbi:sialate O-acetylesterase [Novosphingobium piscinae]|uniref:Sialate O-acetylesterase n=2 Tax=Novosphingobium piscinae TaxID=1507448 RepID=A0A7X1FZZ0_9SPHN|nr:sialate O-acetylesterase [Novosphingobium piscinae]
MSLAPLAATAAATPTLAPIWTDDAVIQKDRPILIEGFGHPGEPAVVTLDGIARAVTVDPTGRFTATFPPRPADARPLTLELSSPQGLQARLTGLAVGEVWLCSGQSNMEMPVANALNFWSPPDMSDPDLRLVNVLKATHHQPQQAFANPVRWQRATMATITPFSASCYYMARELRRRTGMPVGAINASWGGSASRPWLTPAGGLAIYGAADMDLLALYVRDPGRAVAKMAPLWEEWFRRASGGQEPWRHPDHLEWSTVPAVSPWNTWPGSGLDRDPIGTVWLRRTIRLSAEQARGPARLVMGGLDDMDQTWVNGRAVGNTYGWDASRDYALPPGVLRAGDNEVLIAVSNLWGGGGFTGTPDSYRLVLSSGTTLPLDQGWRFSVAKVRGLPPRAPWDRQGGIGIMHNAMIAPLGQVALAGVAWYQGESDVGMPGYADRLKALFAGWRAQFGAATRMVVVQLANFGTPQLAPGPSGWAELREQQRQAVLADPRATLVPALDLGERLDIHPANKNELGRRIAWAALGETPPTPRAARREGSSVRVSFDGVTGRWHSWSNPAPIGFELCAAAPDSCRYAIARIEDRTVVLEDPEGKATTVRYAWADSPLVNLFDDHDTPLPAPGFQLPIQP